jgi:hypothetical protein
MLGTGGGAKSPLLCLALDAQISHVASEALMNEALMQNSLRRLGHLAGFLVIAAMMGACPARADKIKHPIAVFEGLDKITGRTIAFDVATNETVQFGTLQITERACYTRPATEAPQTVSFVQVDEVDPDSKKYKRIFSGWMFASSPGLHGIEHPIYDVWLKDCRGGTSEPVASQGSGAQPAAAPPPPASPETPQNPAPEPSPPPPPDQASKKPAIPAAAEPVDAAPQEQPDAAAPPMGAPIDVGPPPGFVPVPQGNQPPPAQDINPD